MNKEVAVKQDTKLAIVNNTALASQAMASDRKIPLILCMQGLSNLVSERKATMGDIVRTDTAAKLGDPDKSFDFIALNEPVPSWIIEEKVNGKYQYRRKELRNARNDNYPWYFGMKDGHEVAQGTPGATEWRRVKQLSCFIILPSDLEANAIEMEKASRGEFPDLTKSVTPFAISFRSTGIDAGKDIVALFDSARSFKRDGSEYVITLGCSMDKNDQGVFYNFRVDRSKPKPVKPEHKEEVAKWRNLVLGSAVQVEEEPVEIASTSVGAADVC